MTAGPIILVDHGDNTGAGGNQDTMAVIKEALKQGLDDVIAGPICDPTAVAESIAAGVGSDIRIALGGKWDVPFPWCNVRCPIYPLDRDCPPNLSTQGA